MLTEFGKVERDLHLLAGEFGTWAKDKRNSQNLRLQEVESQIVTLNAELASLNIALKAAGAAAALAIPLTGVIAWFAGPFAPFVVVSSLYILLLRFLPHGKLRIKLTGDKLAGLVAAGASTAAVIGIQISIDGKRLLHLFLKHSS